MTLDEAAAELYAQPPADFVRRRDELVALARADGDRDLGTAIGALRKPSAGAWLANLLAAEHGAQLVELVGLGAALRVAQEDLDPDQLRELGRQRYQVVAALVQLARGRAAELGHPAGAAAADELEGTLTAALADPDAGRALLSGRLTHGLAYAGLGFGAQAQTRASGTRGPAADRTATGPRAVPSPTSSAASVSAAAGEAAADGKAASAAERAAAKAAAREAAKAAELDAAERDLAQARLQAAEADARSAAAVQKHREAQDVLASAREQVERVGRELVAAEAALRSAQADVTGAARERDAAAREATTANRRAERTSRTVQTLRTR